MAFELFEKCGFEDKRLSIFDGKHNSPGPGF
jgi:hypothetical protein